MWVMFVDQNRLEQLRIVEAHIKLKSQVISCLFSTCITDKLLLNELVSSSIQVGIIFSASTLSLSPVSVKTSTKLRQVFWWF